MKVMSRLLLALVLALALDGVSKAWAEQAPGLYQPVPLMGQAIRLTLGYNSGMSFGLFAQRGAWLIVVTGPVIVGMTLWLASALQTGTLPLAASWPAGLLLGGALGNFIDRVLDGRVTDFLDVGLGVTRWPTFDLADSFIVVGLALLIWLSRSTKQTGKTHP